MSWFTKRAGKGLDVAPEIGKWAEKEREQPYHSDSAKEAIKNSAHVATELATAWPQKEVIVELSGHFDTGGGSCKVEVQVLHHS